jgi:hypothetical protein
MFRQVKKSVLTFVGDQTTRFGLAPRANSDKIEAMVAIELIRVEVEKEEDGRILASVRIRAGVMAYGQIEEQALRRVKAFALQSAGRQGRER